MIEKIEISSLNLRYGNCRLKSPGTERVLLSSIAEKGITNALQGVNTNEGANGRRILLDGFKRYRCAKRLGISIVPFCSLGGDEACGIMQLLRISIANSLSILEQAVLIDELQKVHMMGNGVMRSQPILPRSSKICKVFFPPFDPLFNGNCLGRKRIAFFHNFSDMTA